MANNNGSADIPGIALGMIETRGLVPAIEAADARELQSADFLLILNRNENIIPAVAKLNAEQAAAYFMLGETQGTSAGGAEEAGKFLRVPGTNPFFPMPHDLRRPGHVNPLRARPGGVPGPAPPASATRARASST